ncbi:MAG: site-2 protease family protein [Thermodesulfobacteriota bacterium]|nr:site-2 protease family protein [Thermodesulfobacteriota bacterium]
MGPIYILFKNPLAFFLLMIPLLYSIIIHEVSHGWVAEKMGDSTARWLGRLSLHPKSHLDPIGTLMLLFFGFGWAKPVPVNFHNVKDHRKGLIWISAAGPLSNIAIAFLAMFILKFGQFSPWSIETTTLLTIARINIILASFNLIPIPPLDGSKILMGLTSENIRYQLEKLEPYGMFIIIGLLFLGILNPLIYLFEAIIASVINLII